MEKVSYISRISATILLLFCIINISSQGVCTKCTSIITSSNSVNKADFEKVKKYYSENIKGKIMPLGERVILFSNFYMSKPYVAKTLESKNQESLIVNFKEYDCTTFLETICSLTLLTKSGDFSYKNYKEQLKSIRYRNKTIDKYPSRLHYFSEWLYDNEKKGYIKNKTKLIGGEEHNKHINFMSEHRKAYKKLENDKFYAEIKDIENELNKRKCYFIPKGDLKKSENKISSGDLIAITTNLKGLDIVHVGFAYRENGILKFMHASSGEKKVVISDISLFEYLKKNKRHTGIMVAELE